MILFASTIRPLFSTISLKIKTVASRGLECVLTLEPSDCVFHLFPPA